MGWKDTIQSTPDEEVQVDEQKKVPAWKKTIKEVQVDEQKKVPAWKKTIKQATPSTRREGFDSIMQQIKDMSPEQQQQLRTLTESDALSPLKDVGKAAGYGVLQGLPFIGTWTDEMMEEVGVDPQELKRIKEKHPNLTTTAEILTALAIPLPGPSKLRGLQKAASKIGIGAGEAALTGAGASEEGERLKGAGISAGIAGGLGTVGHLLGKKLAKGGLEVEQRQRRELLKDRAIKEAGESAKTPRNIMGLDEESLAKAGKKTMKKDMKQFKLDPEGLENTAIKYNLIEDPKQIETVKKTLDNQLDEAYKDVAKYATRDTAVFMDEFKNEITDLMGAKIGKRSQKEVKLLEDKIDTLEDKLALAIEKDTGSVDDALAQIRIDEAIERTREKLNERVIKEEFRPIYKKMRNLFKQKADEFEGSSNIQDLVQVKNDLFKIARSPEDYEIAYRFNDKLQDYVERNAPAEALQKWKDIKKDWSSVLFIQTHLEPSIVKNVNKLQKQKLPQPKDTPELRALKDIFSSGWRLLAYPKTTITKAALIYGAEPLKKKLGRAARIQKIKDRAAALKTGRLIGREIVKPEEEK